MKEEIRRTVSVRYIDPGFKSKVLFSFEPFRHTEKSMTIVDLFRETGADAFFLTFRVELPDIFTSEVISPDVAAFVMEEVILVVKLEMNKFGAICPLLIRRLIIDEMTIWNLEILRPKGFLNDEEILYASILRAAKSYIFRMVFPKVKSKRWNCLLKFSVNKYLCMSSVINNS